MCKQETALNRTADDEPLGWLTVLAGVVRVAFGVVMAVDAYLKWKPAFAAHYVGYIQNAAHGQPGWLAPWFAFWLHVVPAHLGFFVGATRIIESLVALGLLLGVARRFTYLGGAAFSLLIWATAEGFGGPYTAGATNIGPALVYALLFISLAIFARLLGRTPYSLDYHIERRFPAWGRIMEFTPPQAWQRTRPALRAAQQIVAAAAVLVALSFALGTLRSTQETASPTPANAAAAVTPLSLYTGNPVAHAYPAALPPLIGTGDSVDVTVMVSDATVEIASGVQYQAWTFGGTVPAPVIHVRQGQTVNVTFVNNGNMGHSIDFHAAQVAPSVDYRSVEAGGTLKFSFVAKVPGAFIYHCGTPPVLMHMANGMFGAMVVDPATPLPPADASYVLVQSEWYTSQVSGRVLGPNYDKMLAATPDEVVFNGEAYQYADHPLPARAGKRVRLYVVDAGPTLPSAFHVIGAIFDSVYADGDVRHALSGVSAYEIAPGQGVVFDVTFAQPGRYSFVDHSMRNMEIGAMGQFLVSP